MDGNIKQNHIERTRNSHTQLASLSERDILMIDEAITSVGEFGQVNLVVEKGRLRFVVTQQSYDALRFEEGDFNKHY